MGKVIHVAGGDANRLNLQQIMGEAPEGAELRLGAGVHTLEGAVEVNRSIKLVGAGVNQTILLGVALERGLLWFRTEALLQIEHLSIHARGAGRVLRCHAGLVEMNRVHIKGLNEKGVGLWLGEGARARLKYSHLSGLRVGIEASGEARLEARWVEIEGGAVGIDLRARAHAAVQDCVIKGQGQSGLHAREKASASIKNTAFIYNTLGLSVGDLARIDASNCTLRSCEVGARMLGTGKTLMEKNTFDSNGIGIEVGGEARPVLRANKLRFSQKVGIKIFDQASGVFEGNSIRGGKGAGVLIGGVATPALLSNHVAENDGCGIEFTDQAGGEATLNVCTENAVGIQLGSLVQVRIVKNKIVKNEVGLALGPGCLWPSDNEVARNKVDSGEIKPTEVEPEPEPEPVPEPVLSVVDEVEIARRGREAGQRALVRGAVPAGSPRALEGRLVQALSEVKLGVGVGAALLSGAVTLSLGLGAGSTVALVALGGGGLLLWLYSAVLAVHKGALLRRGLLVEGEVRALDLDGGAVSCAYVDLQGRRWPLEVHGVGAKALVGVKKGSSIPVLIDPSRPGSGLAPTLEGVRFRSERPAPDRRPARLAALTSEPPAPSAELLSQRIDLLPTLTPVRFGGLLGALRRHEALNFGSLVVTAEGLESRGAAGAVEARVAWGEPFVVNLSVWLVSEAELELEVSLRPVKAEGRDPARITGQSHLTEVDKGGGCGAAVEC